MSNGNVQDEITGDLTIALKQSAAERLWKMVAIILGLILTGGTMTWSPPPMTLVTIEF